jgi:hypothetical protein
MAADPNWTPAEPLSIAPPGSQQMAVVAAGDVVHLVWVAAKTLYHARFQDGAWQAPVKIAMGEQPALAAGPDGALYCAFANWFLGNREIYVSTYKNDKWSYSQVVSRTPGQSSDPTICVGNDGVAHLAWSDDTPGFSVIYHGVREVNGWTYAPVPNGKGSRPSIAASPSTIYFAWQDRLAESPVGAYEVMACSLQGEEWSLPALISDSREGHSILPHTTTNAADQCHVVWQEEREGIYVIRHSDLWPNGWEAPVDLSDTTADARLGGVLANKLGQFQFIWSEGAVLKHRVRPGEPQGAWWEPEVACEECPSVSEIAAAISDGGELHLVLSRWVNGGDRQLFYLKRKALERKKVFLPIVSN